MFMRQLRLCRIYCAKVCSVPSGGRSGQKPRLRGKKSAAVIAAAAGTPPCLSGQQRMIHQNSKQSIHAPELRPFRFGRENKSNVIVGLPGYMLSDDAQLHCTRWHHHQI